VIVHLLLYLICFCYYHYHYHYHYQLLLDCIAVLQYCKGKGFPYSIPSVGPGADPSVQAVSPQVTVSHPPGGRLPLLSARPAVTSPASEHHCPLAGTKLYCLVTEAHRYKQLAQGCYAASPRAGFELATCWSQAQMPYPLHHCAIYSTVDAVYCYRPSSMVCRSVGVGLSHLSALLNLLNRSRCHLGWGLGWAQGTMY